MWVDKERQQLNAVHENDLENLLKQFGIKQSFQNGEMLCKFCKKVVDKNNLHSILPESGMYNLICDNPECVTKLLVYVEDKKRSKIQ